jgi:hypothetical protein
MTRTLTLALASVALCISGPAFAQTSTTQSSAKAPMTKAKTSAHAKAAAKKEAAEEKGETKSQEAAEVKAKAKHHAKHHRARVHHAKAVTKPAAAKPATPPN